MATPFPLKPPKIPLSLGLSQAAALCLLSMLNHVALTGGRITVSLAAIKMGLSTLEVGLLVAIFAILPMLASIHAGRWMDKIGTRRPLTLATSLICLGTLAPLTFQSQLTLMIAAVAIGSGFMLIQIATQNLLGHAPPGERLRNFSLLSLAVAVSGFSGPLIAGLAIDHLGTRLAFGALALGPLMGAGILYSLRTRLRRTDRKMALQHTDDAPHRLAELLAVRPLRRLLLVNALISGAWDTHLFVVPIYGASIGLSATTIGFILSSFAAATFVIRVFLPHIQRYVQPWTLVRATLAIAALVFLFYPLFTEISLLIALSFILGLGLGSCQPSILSLLHQFSPPGRAAEAVGLRMALISGSQVTLPLTFGALGAVIGIAPLFWIYAATLTTGGWFSRRSPQDTASSPKSS